MRRANRHFRTADRCHAVSSGAVAVNALVVSNGTNSCALGRTATSSAAGLIVSLVFSKTSIVLML